MNENYTDVGNLFADLITETEDEHDTFLIQQKINASEMRLDRRMAAEVRNSML